MSNIQKEKLKQLLRPANIPKSSQSAKHLPGNIKSTDLSSTESRNSTQSTLGKSVYKTLMKSLDQLSANLENLKKKSRVYSKELIESVLTCESSLKAAKQKVAELSLEEDLLKLSDSKISSETSIFLKTEQNEEKVFIDYLLLYEQMKSEVILKISKFPKNRMQEVERVLLEEFHLKNPKFLVVNRGDEWDMQEAQKGFEDLVNRVKKKMLNGGRVLPELECLLDESCESLENLVSDEKSLEGKNFKNSKNEIKERKKLQNLYENSVAENKKLSGKYNYLISKLNKQDTTVRRQAKILGIISKDSKALKETFEEFISEMKFYQSMLQDHFKSAGKSVSVTSTLKEKAVWDTEKEKMKKIIEAQKKDKTELEQKLQNALKELIQLREQENISDDSLDLSRNNINDVIQIQKLKEQIRLLNFKSNELYTAQKEEIDSYKSTLKKLKLEKFSYEERLKSLNNKIFDLQTANDQLLEELKTKTMQRAFQPFRPIPMLSGDTFNVDEPSESSGQVNPADIFAVVAEEVEEVVENLKVHNLFPEMHSDGIGLLKKVVEFVIGLKESLYEESGFFVEVIKDLVQDYKNRANSGDKGFEMEKKADTESFISDKLLEIYKTKLKDKKNQLELCYKQISYLKKSLKESKQEASKTNSIDLECVKGMFANIVKEVAQLNQKTENLIEVMMKTLGFTHDEIAIVSKERKSKKSSWFSKGVL